MKKNIFASIIVFFVGFFCLAFSRQVSIGAIKGISTCLTLIIPSLFVFLVISSFIINTNISRYIFMPIRFIITYVFKVDNVVADVIILSFIGGYPIGAKLISELIKKNQLSITDSKKITIYIVNGGPAFIISGICVSIFNSYVIGITILLYQIICCLLIAFIIRFNSPIIETKNNALLPVDFVEEFINSVVSSGIAVLKMCMFIVFFSSIIEIIKSIIFFDLQRIYMALIFGIIEISYGCKMLDGLYGINAIIIASIISCFGGLCVHFQIFQILKNCKMNILNFYYYKITQTTISSILIYLTYRNSNITNLVFNHNSSIKGLLSQSSIDFSVVLLILCIILLSSYNFSAKIE